MLQGDGMGFRALYEEQHMTLQVHQPQRFCPALARMCAALEQQLGCLVGSNAYLTPAGHYTAVSCPPAHDASDLCV